jgi:hypothetical protein
MEDDEEHDLAARGASQAPAVHAQHAPGVAQIEDEDQGDGLLMASNRTISHLSSDFFVDKARPKA